jgi:hypothetical protein
LIRCVLQVRVACLFRGSPLVEGKGRDDLDRAPERERSSSPRHRQVTPTLFGIAFKHDWAPDGFRLVTTDNADDFDRPANVVTIRPNGTGLRYLTDLVRPTCSSSAAAESASVTLP